MLRDRRRTAWGKFRANEFRRKSKEGSWRAALCSTSCDAIRFVELAHYAQSVRVAEPTGVCDRDFFRPILPRRSARDQGRHYAGRQRYRSDLGRDQGGLPLRILARTRARLEEFAFQGASLRIATTAHAHDGIHRARTSEARSAWSEKRRCTAESSLLPFRGRT